MEELELKQEAPVIETGEAKQKKETISKKQLEKDNETLSNENKELIEHIGELNSYVDKLYANSNTLNNKLDATRIQMAQLKKLTGMAYDILSLITERINAIEAHLGAHNAVNAQGGR